MRNLLAFLAAALIAFVGLGWYLGWYSFQRVPTTAGHQGFNVDINATKIRHDIAKGVQEGEEKLQGVLDKNKTDGSAAPSDPAKAKDKSKPVSSLNGVPQQNTATPRVIIGAEEKEIRPGITSQGVPQ
jgi:hypothetical protein